MTAPLSTFSLTAAGLGAAFSVSALVALRRAHRLLHRSQARRARVVEIGPAEFGAQNFGLVLERNGLRKHLVRLEGSDEDRPVAISSYWWREPGTEVEVICVRENEYTFATDLYFLSGALALAAVAAFLSSTLLWYGPFR